MAGETTDSTATLDADGVQRRSLLKAAAVVPLLAAGAARPSAEEPQAPQRPASSIFVKHAHDEHQVDLGEVVMNYATAGSPGKPALLLVPPQTRSWWNFEAAMKLLAPDFQVFAVDLRGQGRSSRTPGRYTLDNMGNDPEWARSFYDGTVSQSCNHQQMLKKVKVPVLFTHHRRAVDPTTGMLIGAISDFQAQKVKELVESAGQKFEYVSLPDAAHAMHQADPERFADVLRPWAMKLPA